MEGDRRGVKGRVDSEYTPTCGWGYTCVMAWDNNNKRVLVKAIGTVESNLNYTAINYHDPITVGFMQWFGTRAAGVLQKIATAEGVQLSALGPVGNRIAAVGTASQSWNSYFISQAAGNALKPHLGSAKGITAQQEQAIADFEEYAKVARSHGLSPDNNTDAFMMWCVAYHQGPLYAFRVLSAVGGTATLEGMRDGILRNRVLGQYRNRYNQAYAIIKAHDNSGITAGSAGAGSASTAASNGGDSNNDEIEVRRIKSVEQNGAHNLFIRMSTGETIKCSKGPTGLWTVGEDTYQPKRSASSGQTTTSSNAQPVASDANRQAKERKLEAWYKARENKFRYAQAPGRKSPDTSGYTDCSACCYRAYMDCLGVDIGNSTHDQVYHGNLVYQGPCRFDTTKMKYGDLIYFGYAMNSTVHVEMYAPLPGQPLRCWGAGSAPCPHITSLAHWNGWKPWCAIRRWF